MLDSSALPDPAAAAREAVEAAREQLRRVTVIDDEAELRHMLAEMLREDGWVVTELSGARGLGAIAESKPDLLIIDQMLGPLSLDGEEIIARLRRDPDLNQIPIVMCSGLVSGFYDDNDNLNAAAVYQLPKPFSYADLEAAIKAATGARSAE